MSIEVSFYNFSKRVNSTKQPSGGSDYDVVLKDGCSENTPVFLLKRDGSGFPYNYAKWDDRYYFITDVEYTRNNLYTVSCEIDVLATYKSEILSTTAYVSYSSVSGGAWLADTRIPVQKNCLVAASSAAMSIFRDEGFYILSVIGENGCVTYLLALHQLMALLDDIKPWQEKTYRELLDGRTFATTEAALESLAKLITQSDLIGNAYENVPACIRSCIWVPFANPESAGGSQKIFLGSYETGVTGTVISGKPYTGSVTVSIPWHYSDWRRAYCEDVYLYIPLVGMIALSSDSLTGVSAITVSYSYTMTDGTISYQVKAGAEILGTYGGSCAANYPIGINQQASAGAIANSIIAGAEKMVSVGTQAGMNIASAAVGVAAQGVLTGYETMNVAYSTHPSCIGGVGGGSGAGLLKSVYCYTVAHSTVVEPDQMKETMGLPTMKPLTLSSCSGYCQCANAHVAANAHRDELAKIDAFINSGFYIE